MARNFRWVRDIPSGSLANISGYWMYGKQRMRQLPVTTANAIAGGGPTAVITAHVPAGNWGLNKNMLIRGIYQLVIPLGPVPPFYNVAETMSNSQALPIPMLQPGPFTPIPGTYSTWIQRNVVRLPTQLYACDLGDVMQFNFVNFDDNQLHVIPWPANVPPYDFTQQIDVSIVVQLPGGIPGAMLNILWAEAFLEQPGNLGALS